MAEPVTIARPYARAAFSVAKANQDLLGWESALMQLGMIAANEDVRQVALNPGIDKNQVFDAVNGLLTLNEPQQNFLREVISQKRFLLLPLIAQIFSELRAEHDKEAVATVTSAFDLDEAYQSRLQTRLAERLGCQVKLQLTIDPALIGGLVIRVGDWVMDGSLRGQLQRLNQRLEKG